MTPNPIATALSSIQQRQVRALVMGGQACVLYGAAEFSRDLDLALSVSSADLERFRQLLELVSDHRGFAATLASERGLLAPALETGPEQLELLLVEEERAERRRDREYWRPLRSELEQLRRGAS